MRRRHLLWALLVGALAATGCSTLQPTAAPTATTAQTPSPEPTPAASAIAAEPAVVCPTSVWTPPPNIEPITLTCENAVAAAKAVVGPDPSVVKIEFRFGQWCPPGYACPLAMVAVLNGGYVVFSRTGGRDLVVVVRADKAGKVTAANAVPIPPFPIPS